MQLLYAVNDALDDDVPFLLEVAALEDEVFSVFGDVEVLLLQAVNNSDTPNRTITTVANFFVNR